MTNAPYPGFPFAAVVGQEQLKLALILNAIAPRIGGVVVRGEKGTAKTTTVRAFAALIDGAPLVNLPLGATEDRVVGSLNLETVLTTGKAEYQPGLLAQANGGVLYVDEVNLLADHLIDALLDAAATGQVTIERDGISHSSPASFVLVGTMNPEEGELRPQLLDRFGFAVEVAGTKDVEKRADIMRRRLAFEADPVRFAREWSEQTEALAAQIAVAKELVGRVLLSDEALTAIAKVCASFDVDGLRADLVIARAAVAHAAWRGAEEVAEEDIRVAAELALPHRKRRNPFDEPGVTEDELDEALDGAFDEPEQEPQPPSERPEREPDAQPDSDGKAGSADTGAQFRT
ncbi:Magnesium-chelatase 38 kDa subunit [Corynebacterium kalinowskii]|uniref:Magnesium-chelatase 38 kDa subunit n=1 Tax=Corynebacterium kalinowskii TaxID=2675216 RepID=A0A6B8VQY0_9CORY|nr:AAA family ATPase [Corynebacterium kalinowskii]QGU02271.1 Magnesium-chelatase 38 kDa subunit [Corynebacterium kalinowskii]